MRVTKVEYLFLYQNTILNVGKISWKIAIKTICNVMVKTHDHGKPHKLLYRFVTIITLLSCNLLPFFFHLNIELLIYLMN